MTKDEILHWGLMPFSKYAQFEGRSRRKELWVFWALVVGASVIVGMVSDMLSMLIALATLVPTLAVGARRLHDTGRSGWLQLIGLIPFVGWAILVFFFIQEGQKGSNQYGPDPIAAEAVGGSTIV